MAPNLYPKLENIPSLVYIKPSTLAHRYGLDTEWLEMNIKLERALLVVLVFLLFTGCANGYKDFYTPIAGATPENIAARRASPPPEVPLVEHAPRAESEEILELYAKRGFSMIGFSSVNSPTPLADQSAVDHGKALGADLVVILPPTYTGSSTAVIPLTTPTSTTSYTNSTATAYGAAGTVTAYGNSTTTTNGTKTNYIPVTQHRSDYGALYFIKERFIFGARYRELNDNERRQLQTNHGLVILTVVDNSPAYIADLLTDDIIVSLDETTITNGESFTNAINLLRGKHTKVSIIRGGQKLVKDVVLNQ